ncbi:unnamed protein product [Closterium sp. Yama58-4]|nr:unnamed protein product [Closterium sp. Yama58-4]
MYALDFPAEAHHTSPALLLPGPSCHHHRPHFPSPADDPLSLPHDPPSLHENESPAWNPNRQRGDSNPGLQLEAVHSGCQQPELNPGLQQYRVTYTKFEGDDEDVVGLRLRLRSRPLTLEDCARVREGMVVVAFVKHPEGDPSVDAERGGVRARAREGMVVVAFVKHPPEGDPSVDAEVRRAWVAAWTDCLGCFMGETGQGMVVVAFVKHPDGEGDPSVDAGCPLVCHLDCAGAAGAHALLSPQVLLSYILFSLPQTPTLHPPLSSQVHYDVRAMVILMKLHEVLHAAKSPAHTLLSVPLLALISQALYDVRAVAIPRKLHVQQQTTFLFPPIPAPLSPPSFPSQAH